MAGRTGKMTAAALKAKGPRLALVRNARGLEICEEGKASGAIVAMSFSRSYLEKIKAANL